MVNQISPATRASRCDIDEILTSFLASCGLVLQKTPALPAPQRWAAILPTLRAQRLRPIAYWVARQSDFRLSSGVGKELKSAFYAAAVHHERLRFALAELDAWWNRTRILPSHTHVRSLHPDDHLVYLCHHAWLHHGLRKSLGLVDVCLLLRKVEADGTGESVLQREDIGAARRGLWYALLSCQHRYGHALPDTLQRNLRPNNTGPFERMIHALAVRGRLPEAARYGYLWLTIPSRDRVHFLRQFLSASRNAAGVGICQGASHQAP